MYDEVGKAADDNVYLGWSIIKNTLGQGSGAVLEGFAILPSTAGEFEKQGGDNFFYLCRDSNYYHRTNSGQTKSGLITVFIPADEGLEGFIDEYGASVIDNPTPEQKAFIHHKMGAREYLLGEREHYLKDGTPEALEKYREQCRLYPLNFKECFITTGGGAGFNEIILDKRISELKFDDKITIVGDFIWKDGMNDIPNVIFSENPRGRFILSKQLPEGQANKKFFRDGVWWPISRTTFMAGADPFGFSEVEGKRLSNGAICVVERHNRIIDPEENDIMGWTTPSVVCDYSFRAAEVEEYCEDVLKACVYYGAVCNPESNIPAVREYFKRKGFSGYLYYMREEDGKYKKTAGWHMKDASGDTGLGLAVDFIQLHGHRQKHLELLQQCKDLRGKKDLKNKDLLVAFMSALIGIDNDYRSDDFTGGSTYNIENFFRKKR